MDKEPIIGLMNDNISENGRTIKCTERDSLLGVMEESKISIFINYKYYKINFKISYLSQSDILLIFLFS